MEPEIFDHKSTTYDKEFSDSLVGKTQRNQIHQFLNQVLQGKSGLHILELNCGTGEDIQVLSTYGKVIGTDISPSMLDIARVKNRSTEFRRLDLDQPLPVHERYDLIFSNFGGLNCVSPERLHQLNEELAAMLNPGGRLIIVLMSKWSLVEFIYFLLRLNVKKAFRRLKGRSIFKGNLIYYYSQKEVTAIFSLFYLQSKIGTGKFLSGEYMNKWAPRLGITEPAAKPPGKCVGADHVLFDFIKR